MIDGCLVGTGGMMPLPYRWLTSFVLRYNGSNILIDCGEGTQIALRKIGWSYKPIDTILITHFHGDHVSGLPGLLLTMGNADRVEPLTIIGPEGVEKIVRSLLVICGDLPFKVEFIEIRDNNTIIERKGYIIKAFRVKHSVTCLGYSISIKRNPKFLVEKAEENNVPLAAWGSLQVGNEIEIDGKLYTPDMVQGPERKGIKVTYVTDSRPTDDIIENAKGSDLFVCEGMYGSEEDNEKARKKFHMTFKEAAKMGKVANPTEMWLTHFSPSIARPIEFREVATNIFSKIKIPKDGWKIELNFTEE